MSVLCIMATAIMRLPALLPNKTTLRIAETVSALIIAVTVIGRMISGCHWFTDIIAGLLLGSTLVMLYAAAVRYIRYRASRQNSAE
jgi:undecaprenyl-diphosphatase